jgi:hypothetical protein
MNMVEIVVVEKTIQKKIPVQVVVGVINNKKERK